MIQQLVYTIFHYFSLLCTIDTYLYSMEIEILRQKVHFESIHFLPDLELHQCLWKLYLFRKTSHARENISLVDLVSIFVVVIHT